MEPNAHSFIQVQSPVSHPSLQSNIPLKSFTAILHSMCLVILLLSAEAMAQQADYRVVIDAPGNVKSLIVENLALAKRRSGEPIDEAQLKRLVDEAKTEIETLVATEGYYAPTIEATLERDGAAWIARFKCT